jgi:hypothetical protein
VLLGLGSCARMARMPGHNIGLSLG